MVQDRLASQKEQLLLQSLPLLGGIALGCPSVDSSDLSLKRGVDEPVSRKHCLAFELRGNNDSLECLSTAAYEVSKSQNVSKRRTKRKRECFDVIASFPSEIPKSIPDKSSTSTWSACSVSVNLFFSDSAVIPDVSAIAALMAAWERAVRENEARWM